jgi:hypothetical protein
MSRGRLTSVLPLAAALFVAAGCRTRQAPVNQPLPPDAGGRSEFARAQGFGRCAAEVGAGAATWAGAGTGVVVFLAFPGGQRSSAFGHGVLPGLRGPAYGYGMRRGRGRRHGTASCPV